MLLRLILSNAITKYSETLQKNIIKIAKSDQDGVTAIFDGWTNVKQEHIWGVVFLTTSGQPLIWGAYDISAERSKTEDVIRHIEKLMTDANEGHINIKAFISDLAGEYAAAWRQLRRKYPSKIFLPYMAHQMNLIFGEIFKESELHQRISKEVIRIVSFFHNSTFFTGSLRDEQKRPASRIAELVKEINGVQGKRKAEDSTKFLEEREEVKDDFTKPHELCINRFDFQRKGRDETLHKIYDCIVKRYISIKNTLEKEKSVGDKSLHPILALQATPGGGKSFLLDELAALKSEDFDNYLKSKEQPNRECSFIIENAVYHEYIEIVNDVIDILRNSIVVCITYNGSSTYKNDSFVDANVQRGLVMRILWSYFFDDAKLSWQGFCEKFSTNFESLDIYTAVQSILYHSSIFMR
ncbi:unnamed protein product [Rhizophagus irregularis]|nr:unnamed protein product [Rhizophagus irregularis]